MMMLLTIAMIYAVSVGLGCGIGWAIAWFILRRMHTAARGQQAGSQSGAVLPTGEQAPATI